jgi:hypothetical protein
VQRFVRRRPAAPRRLARSIVAGPPSAYRDHATFGPQFAAWLAQIQHALDSLVQGVAAVQLDTETGVLTLTPTADESKLTRHKGYQLLSRIVASKHPVTIVPEGKEPMARVAEKDVPIAATPGQGAGSKIEFPPDIIEACKKLGAFYAVEGEGGKPVPETQPHPGIMLGHELIHADHAQRGAYVPAVEKTKQVHAYADLEENVLEEELRTVGIGSPQLSAEDITENQLRAELKLPARLSYRPHTMNVEAKASKDKQAREDEAAPRKAKAFESLHRAIKAFNEDAPKLNLPRITSNVNDEIPALYEKLTTSQTYLSEFEDDNRAEKLRATIAEALETSREFAPTLSAERARATTQQ